MMSKEQRGAAITTICEKCGCNEEQKKRHFRLYVDEQWNVHPSKQFKKWWFSQEEYRDSLDENGNGISPIAALNARRIHQDYLRAKEIGAA